MLYRPLTSNVVFVVVIGQHFKHALHHTCQVVNIVLVQIIMGCQPSVNGNWLCYWERAHLTPRINTPYSTVALVLPISTMYVWRGIT